GADPHPGCFTLGCKPLSSDFRLVGLVAKMSRSCIIAIDFGTAYSGYAFCLSVNQQEVQHVKRWGRRASADTAKTPTCILFDENQEFMEFGYKARDKEIDLLSLFSVKCCLFHCWILDLLFFPKQKITKDLMIKDVNKKSMSAMKVFSAALHFLKEDALKTLDKEIQDLDLDLLDFTWVLTVPAIWDIPARQFMREAAEQLYIIQATVYASIHHICLEMDCTFTVVAHVQAGLVSVSTEDKLVITLESEAASIRCKQLESEDFMMNEVPVKINLCPGTQYIVVDCGGGTIDITVHEVLEGGGLKELHKASGNNKGGRLVDRKFTRCMREFFCDGLWEEYESDHPREAQEFMEDFIIFRQNDHANVRRLDFYKEFKNIVQQRQSRNEKLFNPMEGLTFHWTKQPNSESYSAKLEISEQRKTSFFRETLIHVTDCLHEIISEHPDIRYILLVGGLSSSHILREHVKREFSDQAEVMCPKIPQEVILRGAVMFGRDPSEIRSRKSAFTYGVGTSRKFDPSVHKEEKRFTTKEGVVLCTDLFKKFVGINEDVEWNQTKEYEFGPIERDQKSMRLSFYRTERENVTYVDEWGVDDIKASCVMDMPDISKGLNRKVKLEVFFGSTEIKAKATDLESKNTSSVKMDFITKQEQLVSSVGICKSFP
uniref:Heat shock 70 kDa protein 12B n=1 Tax=Neogobius melanostomus TaxID=47308 RepID=A0A8C6UUK4_9GOBI